MRAKFCKIACLKKSGPSLKKRIASLIKNGYTCFKCQLCRVAARTPCSGWLGSDKKLRRITVPACCKASGFFFACPKTSLFEYHQFNFGPDHRKITISANHVGRQVDGFADQLAEQVAAAFVSRQKFVIPFGNV